MAQYCPNCKCLLIGITGGDGGVESATCAPTTPVRSASASDRRTGAKGHTGASRARKDSRSCPKCGWPRHKRPVAEREDAYEDDLVGLSPAWPDFTSPEWADPQPRRGTAHQSYSITPPHSSRPWSTRIAHLCIAMCLVLVLLLCGFLLVCRCFFPGWLTYTVGPWLRESSILNTAFLLILGLAIFGGSTRRES